MSALQTGVDWLNPSLARFQNGGRLKQTANFALVINHLNCASYCILSVDAIQKLRATAR